MKAIKPSQSRASAAESRKRRRKINPASPPTTVDVRGVQVHFPFKPYECQEAYMEKVMDALLRSENALLESPTGTGKTLCLLCSCLAWQREQGRLLNQSAVADLKPHGSAAAAAPGAIPPASQEEGAEMSAPARSPVIIYASRTHSQLSQVVRELRNTRYRPSHAILGSRSQMCVHPKVKKADATASEINHDCSRLCKDRKCRYRNKLETFAGPPQTAADDSNYSRQAVLDMEDLVEMGKKSKVCPFYYTRQQVEHAELILVPYNYLFDKEARKTFDAVPWSNSVVIFDEAHNLESIASESASFDLSYTDLASCVREIERARGYLQAMPDLSHNLKEDNLLKLKSIFLQLETYIEDLGPQTAYAGEFMMELLQQGAGINHANHRIFIEELAKINDMIMDMRGSGATRGSARLEHFTTCLKRVFGHDLESRCLAKANFYRVHVSPKQQSQQKQHQHQGRTISYWCFAPSLAMEELSNLRVRSILVTSGTLSPLPSYRMELGIPFPHSLENPHIIEEDQIHVRVIGKGVSGKLLSSSYERRQDGEYYSELGNTLVSLAKVVPAGMLIFFPSYGVMDTCVERWGGPASSSSRQDKNAGRNKFFAKRKPAPSNRYSFPIVPASYYTSTSAPATPWKRLLRAKSIVLEPRSSADLPDAIAEFQKFLTTPKSPGCILMGVCRGKISEGIDFAHDMSRAVVITGLPFAPAFDPKVKLKREFLDAARSNVGAKPGNDGGFAKDTKPNNNAADRLSGNEWYTQQAHRAVNQAIGRVIRNKSDYGAVILMDSRFSQPRNQEGLSKWLRPHIQNDEGFGLAIRGLAHFYRHSREQEKVRAAAAAKQKELALEYEKEDEEELFTKVAVVRNQKDVAEGTSDADKSNDNMETNAYIPGNQIVARYDARDTVSKVDVASSSSNMGRASNDGNRKPPPGNDLVFQTTKVSKPTGSSSTTTLKKAVPVLFMEKTKKLLSLADQATIRKLIVQMKCHGDKKDTLSYHKTAHAIISIILTNGEKTATPPETDDSRMLYLFFRLLPEAYRLDVEKMAVKMIFGDSTLGKLSKNHLLPVDHGMVQSTTVSLLHKLWFTSATSPMQSRDFLRQAESILTAFSKVPQGRAMLQAFFIMIPSRLVDHTRMLFTELCARINIEKMKRHEKARVGQATIDTRRFMPGISIMPNSLKQDNKIPTSGDTTEQSAIASVSSAKTTGNPYRRSALEKKLVSNNPYARKGPKEAKSETSAKLSCNATASGDHKPKQALSLTTILKTMENDIFVKRTPGDIARSLETNVPKNIACPFCFESMEHRMKRLMIAECGHTGCSDCWKKTLKIKKECPTCKRPVFMETLALTVYEK